LGSHHRALSPLTARLHDAYYLLTMPPRTNAFQQVVATIHQHMAGDADLQESAMLRNRVTGAEQEVDVVIRSRPAGHEVIVSVEATDRGRKADIEWVQQMLGKHADLPTSKLVLVSGGGFTERARRLADAVRMPRGDRGD
jgi:hypothetical protein